MKQSTEDPLICRRKAVRRVFGALAGVIIGFAVFVVPGASQEAKKGVEIGVIEGLREQKSWTPAEVKAMIPRVAEVSNYPRTDLLVSLALAESTYRPYVVGDGGKAFGPFQYHQPTWDLFVKESGMTDLKRDNPVDQTILTMWALSHGKWQHWTPLRKYRNDPYTIQPSHSAS